MDGARATSALRAIAAISLLCSIALSGCSSSGDSPNPDTTDQAGAPRAPAEPEAPPRSGPLAYERGSVIVRFQESAGGARKAALRRAVLARVGGSFVDRDGDGVYDRFAHVDRSGRLMKVELPESVSVKEALAQLRRDPAVAYAEPNYILRIAAGPLATPDDPLFGSLWGLHNTGQTGGTADADIDAPEAWELSTGSRDIVVGVVDTGVDYTHPELVANLWTNPGEVAGNGLDDDGNGVVDDVHGFNALTGGGDPMDDNAHGTHCSGTIGAAGNNGRGVAGVNWAVSIMALKFLSASGDGTLEGAIAAIDYALGQKLAGVNLRVLSNSWSGGGYSQGLKDAIEVASAADILFVAAAGNDYGNDNDVFPTYPASYDLANIVAVASTDHDDELSIFSSIGPASVDLGAPGSEVLSTVPGNGYDSFSGTSMATTHVSGVAALVLAFNPTLSTAELKELLLSSGDAISALAGVTVSGRRLNAASALAAAGPPVPRFSIAATPTSRVMNQGDSTSYQLELAAVLGFSGDVSLTVSSSPPIEAALQISPQLVGAPGVATLSAATTLTTEPGLYELTITGVSGALTRSRTVALRVRPFGTVEASFPSTDTPLDIPDGDQTGVDSVLQVTEGIDIQSVEVDLDVTHTWVGDLRITLTSPEGTEVVLHERGTGGSSDDLHRTYSLPTQFTGELSVGAWVMHLDDDYPADEGTLDRWTLRILGTAGSPTFGLSVAAGPDEVAQGQSVARTVNVSSLLGFTGAVALSATSQPALAGQLTLSPSSVTAPGSSTLTIAPACDAELGDYAITVTGESGGVVRSTQVMIHVMAAGFGALRRATGVLLPPPPVASFTFAIAGLTASFTDTSDAPGGCSGELVSWAWDFGDGATSTAQHPTHPYAAAGTYLVTLTVTNAAGLSSTASRQVTVRTPVQLLIESISRDRATFEFIVELSWRGAVGPLVELHRNGALVDLPDNDGATRDQFRRYETAFTWKLCEQQSSFCSNEVSVVFGGFTSRGEPTEATIVTKVGAVGPHGPGDDGDGSASSRVVRIEDVD